MLTGIHLYTTVVFIATVLLTMLLFLKTVKNKTLAFIIPAWLLLTGMFAYKGFFLDTSTAPPKFILAIGPPLLAIVLLFTSQKGRIFIDKLDIRSLTLISIVRIPVELVLYWLSIDKAVPVLMTFTGRNFDIIAGITSLIIYFVCFDGARVTNRLLLLVWNIISLGLLLNIVITAVLSAPFSFQQFAFDQPNIAILHFPFIWLPCFVVMAVLFSHLVSLRRLLLHQNKKNIFTQ